MIGPFHLVLMFWFGGAVCFAGALLIGMVTHPERFEELGLTLPQMVVFTLVWPVALIQGYRMAQQEAHWNERRRVHQAREDPPPPPEPCTECFANMQSWDEAHAEFMREHPPQRICAECLKGFEEWREKHDVPVVECD